MRPIISMLLVFLCPALLAQRNIEKKIPVQANQTLLLDFDFPELIKVYTSTTNDFIIKAKVSINRGENDEAFELNSSVEGSVINVSSTIRDKEKLPKRLLIKRGDQEYYFKTDSYDNPEVKKFLEDKEGEYGYMNSGVVMEVELDVYVPKGVATNLIAKYGLVEVVSCDAPLTITAQYGGVDATIVPSSVSELNAQTRYGEILTNLPQQPLGKDWGSGHDKWIVVNYKFASGYKLNLESKYGKIYLRKSQ